VWVVEFRSALEKRGVRQGLVGARTKSRGKGFNAPGLSIGLTKKLKAEGVQEGKKAKLGGGVKRTEGGDEGGGSNFWLN